MDVVIILFDNLNVFHKAKQDLKLVSKTALIPCCAWNNQNSLDRHDIDYEIFIVITC